jgi:transposase-like protein
LSATIDGLLADRIEDAEKLAEIGQLGARLLLQRALDAEVAKFLNRGRYQRTAAARRSRNGVRSCRIQTGEGELQIAVPQLRHTADRFVSQVLPDCRTAVRTEPLETLTIGAYVRGFSDRDIEALVAEAGLGTASKGTVSQICRQLRSRYQAFHARSWRRWTCWYCSWTPFTGLPTPAGPRRESWWRGGYTRDGSRVLLDVCLGQRERHEDWLDLGRALTRRGLRPPFLVVTDGAPGLVRAVEELRSHADSQRCAVHRLRNILAKLPKDKALLERIRKAYWAALDEAQDPQTLRTGCGLWSPNWNAPSPAPRPAWLMICRL